MLSDVRLSDWDDESRQPVLDAESVELELSPMPRCSGNVVISTARLVQADPQSSRSAENRYAPVAPRGGRIGRARGARAVVAKNPASPDVSALAERSVRHGRVQPTASVMDAGRPGWANRSSPGLPAPSNGARSIGAANFRRPASGAAKASRSTLRRPSRWSCLPAARRQLSIDVKAAPHREASTASPISRRTLSSTASWRSIRRR